MPEATELTWDIDGLTYAGLTWGDGTRPPAIALHGWMDNALSFSRLGPLIHQRQLYSLDLSGHGLTSRRSPDSSYQLWDEIPQLLKIANGFESETVTVIGHSRGAGIAVLLALALGERCDRLVLIDGLLWPGPKDVDPAVQFQRFFRDRSKYEARGERYFPAVADFIESRSRFGFSEENARIFVPRALEETPQGYRLRADPRLFGSSVLRLNEDTRHAFYGHLQMPVLGIFGDEGFFKDEPSTRLKAEGRDVFPTTEALSFPDHIISISSCKRTKWRGE